MGLARFLGYCWYGLLGFVGSRSSGSGSGDIENSRGSRSRGRSGSFLFWNGSQHNLAGLLRFLFRFLLGGRGLLFRGSRFLFRRSGLLFRRSGLGLFGHFLLRCISLLLRRISLSQCGSVSLLLWCISLGNGLAVPGFLFAAGLFLALGPFGLLCLFAECLFDFLNHGRSIDEGGLHRDALGFLVEDGFYEEGIAAETGEGIARSTLLAFLLGIAAALACGESFEQDGAIEERTVVLLVEGFFVLEINLHAVLLRPFKEFTLEVDLLVGYVFDVEQATHDFVLNEPLASLVAAVKIDGADEGLEGIATDIAIVAATLGGHLEQPL